MCLNQYDFPYENRGGKAIGQSGIGERAQVVANTKPGEGGGRWNKNNEGSFESVGWIIRIRSMTLGISYPRVLFNVVACSLPAAGVNSILFRYFKRCTFETSFFFLPPPHP